MKVAFYHDAGSEIWDVSAVLDGGQLRFAGNIYRIGTQYRWFPNTDAANNPLDTEFLQGIVDKLKELNGA